MACMFHCEFIHGVTSALYSGMDSSQAHPIGYRTEAGEGADRKGMVLGLGKVVVTVNPLTHMSCTSIARDGQC